MALLLALSFATSAFALDVFHSNCSIPVSTVSFATAPNTRGTLDILWTSLATIIACVFTVLHLNVPEQRRGRNPGRRGDLYWSMKDLRTSLSYSLLMIFIPELMLGKAFKDRSFAKLQLKQLHESLPETKNTWTLQHFLYADMGGLVVVTDGAGSGARKSTESHASNHHYLAASQDSIERASDSRTSDDETTSRREHSRSHCRPDNAAGTEPVPYVSERPHDKVATVSQLNAALDIELPDHGDVEKHKEVGGKTEVSTGDHDRSWIVTSNALVFALEENLIPREPPLTAAEIADKSKADLVSKAVAIFQICYFVVGIVIRAAQHLPVSQLELGTCAFVPYAIAIYIASRDKPKSPRTTTKLAQVSTDAAKKMTDRTNIMHSIFFWLGMVHNFDGSRIPNHRYILEDANDEGTGLTFLLPVLLSMPFGAIHLAAWNFQFPTSVEGQLWRVAAIVITVALPALFIMVLLLFFSGLVDLLKDVAEYFAAFLAWAFLFSFLVARLVIIIEMFRTLTHLPPEGYVATWTANVPHFG